MKIIFCLGFGIVFILRTCSFPMNPDAFEGDIDPKTFQRTEESEDGINIKTRLSVDDERQLWPGGIIPYYNTFRNDPSKNSIKEAIQHIQERTCLKFRELSRPGQVKDYVNIYDGRGKGCLSLVGKLKVGGEQRLSLEQPKCNTKNFAIHELLHTAGLWHLHSREDRDKYINVYLRNVRPGQEYAFRIQKGRYIPGNFDFNSIVSTRVIH